MKLRFVAGTMIIALLILSAFVSPSGTRAQYGVSLECQSNEHYTEYEQYTNYQIKIINTGESDDTYILIKESPPEDWQTQLSIQIISIPAQESRYITLKVKPTCECESGTKVSINVTATSESDANVFDMVQTITTYAKVKVSLDTETDYVQLDRGESYSYEIIVRNEGSENDSFMLTVSHKPELSAVLGAEYITLSSKINGTVNLTVTAQPIAHFGYYNLIIGAESLHNSERSDVLTITTIIGKIMLIAHNITLSNKHPKEGETISISAEILNNGSVNATDLLLTTYYLTKNDLKIEIGSEFVSIESGEIYIVQKDMKVTSNFTGILIKAKIKGNYEIWEESFTTKDLGFKFQESYALPYHLLALLALVLIAITLIILKLSKRMKE